MKPKTFIPIGNQTSGVVFDGDYVVWYELGCPERQTVLFDDVEFCSYINDHSHRVVEPGHWNTACKSGKSFYLLKPPNENNKSVVAVRTPTFEKDFEAFVNRCTRRVAKLKEAIEGFENKDVEKFKLRAATDQQRMRELHASLLGFLSKAPFHHQALVYATTLKLLLR